MIKYVHALRARRRALVECELARQELQISVDVVVGAYQAHSTPVLAGAAGIGFVLALFGVGAGLMRTGARIAIGPAWFLVRPFVDRAD